MVLFILLISAATRHIKFPWNLKTKRKGGKKSEGIVAYIYSILYTDTTLQARGCSIPSRKAMCKSIYCTA